jgi:hypothetical protein
MLQNTPTQSRFVIQYAAGAIEPMHTHTATVEIFVISGMARVITSQNGIADICAVQLSKGCVIRFVISHRTVPGKGAYTVLQAGLPHSVQALTDCTLLHMFSGGPIDLIPLGPDGAVVQSPVENSRALEAPNDDDQEEKVSDIALHHRTLGHLVDSERCTHVFTAMPPGTDVESGAVLPADVDDPGYTEDNEGQAAMEDPTNMAL